jgi:hypothetical protein
LVTGILDIGDQSVTGISDTGHRYRGYYCSCNLVTGVMGTGHKLVTGIVDIGDQLVTDIVDTSDILVTWLK